MKRNKFIYLIIFSLVFLGFTNGVKAKECIYFDGEPKHVDMEYNPSTSDSCHYAHKGIWSKEDAITNAFVSGIEKVCAKKTNGKYEYRATVYSLENANACSDNGFSWQNVKDIIKDVYNLSGTSASATSSDNGCCMKQDNVYTFYKRNSENECSSLANQGYGYNMGYMSQAKCNAESVNSGNGNAQIITNDTTNNNNSNNNNNSSDPDNNHSGNGTVDGYSGSTGTDTMTVGFDCDDPDINSIVKTIKTIYNLLRFSVPVILIIMGSIDFLKATIAGKEDEIEKHKKTFINRLFLAVIIFMLLSIFQLTTNILEKAGVANSNSWVECWNHVND